MQINKGCHGPLSERLFAAHCTQCLSLIPAQSQGVPWDPSLTLAGRHVCQRGGQNSKMTARIPAPAYVVCVMTAPEYVQP